MALDAKTKKSDKFSFLTAGALVALAVAVFIGFYPTFKRQASVYYTDFFRSSLFLQNFYQSNLVLYKNMVDKRQQTDTDYSDLYLEMSREKASLDEYGYQDPETYYEEELTIGKMENMLAENLDEILEGWKESTLNELGRSVDYCVIDHKTGEHLKNTQRGIERLYEDKSIRDEDAPYVYYVMMTYDSSGDLSDVSVRDGEPDALLKNVQSVMGGEWLRNALEQELGILASQRKAFYFEGEEKLTYRVVDRPKDMTFIYACTAQQKEDIHTIGVGGISNGTYRWEVFRTYYYDTGVVSVYWYIMAVLAIFALLLTRIHRYGLHRMPMFKIHPEFSLFAICILWGGFSSVAVEIVCFTNTGYFPVIFDEYLKFLPTGLYSLLETGINVLALALIFGIWYYSVTSLGEVLEVGPKEFLKERSLIVGIVRWVMKKTREKKEHLVEEVLHVDLGQEAEKTIRKLVAINFLLLAAICMMWMFGWGALVIYSIVLYMALKKYVRRIQGQYRKLLMATRSIAEGNLQTEFEEDWGVFESYKEELVKIQDGFKRAVAEEVKSQRMKTELITNVSHDLKTPLTAITTYIELLGDEGVTPEQRKEYLEVLERKSERLKVLIEDLFEVSKASSGNVTLNRVDVDICNLMRQVYLEYEDKVEEADLTFRFRMPEEKVVLQLDSQKTYRVFENLYVNIIKYAMPHTRVYVTADKTEKGIAIELKNMSAVELDIKPEELTERFVRGDSARNTEGSGLGLAIARSFVELQGGKMKVGIDGDLFKVTISWQQ